MISLRVTCSMLTPQYITMTVFLLFFIMCYLVKDEVDVRGSFIRSCLVWIQQQETVKNIYHEIAYPFGVTISRAWKF
jgi:hypothetical protein